MNILVTGGAGFIGSNFIIEILKHSNNKIVNLDKLTYAGNLQNLVDTENHKNYTFVKGCTTDTALVAQLLTNYRITTIVNFAAESHVDRSIHSPNEFVQTNIVGTFNILKTTLHYWQKLEPRLKNDFRFLHVSTDEVYGTLTPDELPFDEYRQYRPNSPYSATKASSDHLVRSYFHTYGLPVLTTNCSNNYGPFQFPEKLIPLVIYNAVNSKKIPIYGDGLQIRDWLFVVDHCLAINEVIKKGQLGEVYNIGGLNEKTNLEVVNTICHMLDKLIPKKNGTSYTSQITFVEDRKGHDKRYAVNTEKITKQLHWQPKETFETGIEKTVQWYLSHQNWVKNTISGDYRHWITKNYR